MSKNNFGVDVFSSRAWSDRACEFQRVKGRGLELRSRAKAQILRKNQAIEALADCLNADDDICQLKVQIAQIQSALKESLAEEASWAWSDREQAWAKSMIQAESTHAAIMLTVSLFADEYGMTVTKEWGAQIVNACGLSALKCNTARGFVNSGNVGKRSATKISCLNALMVWSVNQLHINGMCKYIFADDICEMYAPKKRAK